MVADILNHFFYFIVHLQSFNSLSQITKEFVFQNGDGSSVLCCASLAFETKTAEPIYK